MKKVAVFVEGQTEQIFADHLIRHIFGHTNEALFLNAYQKSLEGGRD